MTTPPHPSTSDVLARIGEHKVVVVIRSSSRGAALEAARALIESGAGVIEVTYTTPGAAGVISTLRAEAPSDVQVGAGTIGTADEARSAADSGAEFLVSPGSPPALIEAMLSTGCLVIPGVLTPTEIMTTRALGIGVVKLFPASLIGPRGLTTLRGPFPDMAFIPTGGLAIDDIDTWLDAGALAVGLGTKISAIDYCALQERLMTRDRA